MIHGSQDDTHIRYPGIPALCDLGTIARNLRTIGDAMRPGHHSERLQTARRQNHWEAKKNAWVGPARAGQTLLFPLARLKFYRERK